MRIHSSEQSERLWIIIIDNNQKSVSSLRRSRFFYGVPLTSAPAACRTIADFLNDTNTSPEDYDMILTGDLGAVGSELLCELMVKQENIDISSVHSDCGLMLYDLEKQKDVGAGGSGCGCSGAVLCSDIFGRMENGELKKVLFVGTGALMSSVSSLQSESIPSIAHGILLTGR